MTRTPENDDRAVEIGMLDAAAWVLESERSEAPAFVDLLVGLTQDEAVSMIGHLVVLCGYCLDKPEHVTAEDYLTRFITIGQSQTYDLDSD